MDKIWFIVWIAGWPSEGVELKSISDIPVSGEEECRALEERENGMDERGIFSSVRCYYKLVPKKDEKGK